MKKTFDCVAYQREQRRALGDVYHRDREGFRKKLRQHQQGIQASVPRDQAGSTKRS